MAWGKPGLKNPGVMAEIFWFGHVRVYIYMCIFDYIWIYLAIWFFGPCRIWDGNNGKRIRKLEIWSLILERKKRLGRKMNRKGLQRLKYVDVFVKDLNTEHGSNNNLPISAPRTQACIVVTCSSVLMILSRPTSYLECPVFCLSSVLFHGKHQYCQPSNRWQSHGLSWGGLKLYHFELEWLSHVILKYYI